MKNMKRRLTEKFAKGIMNFGDKAANEYSVAAIFYEIETPKCLLKGDEK